MKSLIIRIVVASVLLNAVRLKSQGFVNLDFGSANLLGYNPGSINVPISAALPGWNAYFINDANTQQLTQVTYDTITAGGNEISVVDNAGGSGVPGPLQGTYGALVVGTDLNGNLTAMISQTGVVPAGISSITMDVATYYALATFYVVLGGQQLNMIPLENFPEYTVYGANISEFAGNLETLQLVSPPSGGPNAVEFDNIQFSPSPVPEPSSFSLFALGTLFLAWRHWPGKLVAGRQRESHAGGARRTHSEARAPALLAVGLKALGLGADEVVALSIGAPEKTALAWWLRERTTVSLRWVSEELAMGHYTRASQAVSRLQRKPGKKLKRLQRLLLAAEEKVV